MRIENLSALYGGAHPSIAEEYEAAKPEIAAAAEGALRKLGTVSSVMRRDETEYQTYKWFCQKRREGSV